MPIPVKRTAVPGSPAWHRQMFSDFARWEVASGGPDPHMRLAVRLATDSDDPAWTAGCYVGPYIVSTGLAITDTWSRRDVLARPRGLEKWIGDHWGVLPIRKERKVNGVGPKKLAETLAGYARWLDDGGLERVGGAAWPDSLAAVDPPNFGRYFGMKLYETLRRTVAETGAGPEIPEMEDVVPSGGRYSRKGLALLYPEHDYRVNGKRACDEAVTLTTDLRDRLADEGVPVSWFVLEVLLCNYRQGVDGGQYPGRAHDSELGHLARVGPAFPAVPSRLLAARAELFPGRCLGEVGEKWAGRRLELGKVMTERGYVWSDLLYDYVSTSDLGRPAKWRD